MKLPSTTISAFLVAVALHTGCDSSDSVEEPAAAADRKTKPDENAAPVADASKNKLETLKATLEKGGSFDDALAAVEKQMGESPLQQGEFWNFGEYDTSGACVHMVLVRGGDKVQQVQFTKYEPGSSGFGWCAEMKIEKS